MEMIKLAGLLVGILVSMGIGGLVVKCLNRRLRCYIGILEATSKLTPTMGYLERGIYTWLFYSDNCKYIFGLFALLAAQKLLSIQKIEAESEENRLALYKENIERTNVYFISSFVSLLFGVFGGWIIRYFLK